MPDRSDTLTTAVPCPYSAEKELDCTENSWIASTDGTIEATSKYWLETLPPSIMNTVFLYASR